MSLNETISLIAMLFSIVAFSVGYVTLITALSSVQPFFVLIFSIALTVFYPKILEEEINKSVIVQKTIAVLLIFIGAILVII